MGAARFELDERGIRAAYSAHAGEMFGFAVRSLNDRGLAEEAVQETFVRAWRFGERFDPQLGTLRTWLFAILRHVVIDIARSRATLPQPASDDLIQRVSDGEPAPTDAFDQALLAWQIEEALRRIGDAHRRVDPRDLLPPASVRGGRRRSRRPRGDGQEPRVLRAAGPAAGAGGDGVG